MTGTTKAGKWRRGDDKKEAAPQLINLPTQPNYNQNLTSILLFFTEKAYSLICIIYLPVCHML